MHLKVLYNVVHHRWMRPDIVKELLWRRHVYNNAIVSLRKLFKEESAKNSYEGTSFFRYFAGRCIFLEISANKKKVFSRI